MIGGLDKTVEMLASSNYLGTTEHDEDDPATADHPLQSVRNAGPPPPLCVPR